MNSKKLHLGCGPKIIPGWINIDIASPAQDVFLDDVTSLQRIDDGSADIIYACHVLEHTGRYKTEEVLKVWYNKLRTGGIVRISVPDLNAVFKKYRSGTELSTLMGFLYGGQRNEYDYHSTGFDFVTLEQSLIGAGFQNVRRYDWRRTEHANIDDYSQAYLPHMEKENGTLMSLNVEAEK